MEDYMDFDVNLIRQYIQASPEVLTYINDILNYRNLVTQQAYYSKLVYAYRHYSYGESSKIKELKDAGEIEFGYWKEQIQKLDFVRRKTHNKALSAFNGILEVGRKNNLDYMYIGAELKQKEINSHDNLPARKRVTDAMFKMLESIEENIWHTTEPNKGLGEIRKNMERFNNDYHVKKSLIEDESLKEDGGIEFDFKTNGNFNNNENL